MNQHIRGLFIDKIKSIYLWDIRGLLLLTILFSGIFSYVLYVGYIEIYNARLRIEYDHEITLKQEIINNFAIVKSLSLYESKMLELEELDQSLNEKLFYGDEVSSVIILINEVAGHSGLSITSINPEINSDKLKNNIESKHINVILEGDSASLNEFIYELVKLKKVMQISEMKINRIDDNKLDIHLILTIFQLVK